MPSYLAMRFRAGNHARALTRRGTVGRAVFGGVLVVQQPDGTCWTMRHVDPKVPKGSASAATTRT